MWYYFIAGWIIAGIVCWNAAVWYTRICMIKAGLSYEEIKEALKSTKSDIVKWPIYLLIWPVCMLAVLYNAWYSRYMVRKMIKNFSMLDKES